MLIDCHSHLSFMEEAALQKVMEIKNKTWVLGGYNFIDWEKQKEIKEKYPNQIQTCFGLHPWYVLSSEFSSKKDLLSFEQNCKQADWVGEVGLDFFVEQTLDQRKLQENIFKEQIRIAKNQTFVFHIVQAHGMALNILKNEKVTGFVHRFSGSLEVALNYYENGILLSFGPNILAHNSKKTRETLKNLPMGAILIESDTPQTRKDQSDPNEIYIKVLEEVAKIKKIDKEEVSLQVEENFKNLRSKY